jgi:hypothetical protein
MTMDADIRRSNDWIELLALVERFSCGLDTKDYALSAAASPGRSMSATTSRRLAWRATGPERLDVSIVAEAR